MPKVNVYPPKPDDATQRVEVGWHTGVVQIATTTLAAAEASEPTWMSDAYVDLDRGGINQLIRALREARDKAYGRDE